MKTEAIFDNIAKRIEEQINLAEDKIFIAVAWFTNKNLFQALCKKASEGVKVKLVISDNEINRNSTINHSDIQIGKSKLYWIETHNKFCIIDDYVVITGSYNWSYKAENNIENIIICSGDNDLVKQFKKELKRIIKDYPQDDAFRPFLKRIEAEKSGSIKPNIPFSKFREYDAPPVIPSTKKDFESIKIGEQEWMVKNLNVDRFRNGDLIPHIKDGKEWKEAGRNSQPAWCYYDNNSENGKIYGKLYNWYAVIDNRGLAPDGWHVPLEREWTALTTYLGGESVAGDKMKSVWGRNDWEDESMDIWNGNNFSGFNALPGGLRNGAGGSFHWIRRGAFLWSATINGVNLACLRDLHSKTGLVKRSIYDRSFGASVRCIKGSSSSKQIQVFKPDDIKRFIPPTRLK
jgi:uncharacterized protein (TIGR02145 family)